MKQGYLPVVVALIAMAIGLGIGFAIWAAPPGPTSAPPTTDEGTDGQGGATDAASATDPTARRPADPLATRPRKITDATPADTWRPKIRAGDEHAWEVCADEHHDYVLDEIGHPSLYMARKDVLGRRFMIRWPEQIGLHFHMLGRTADGRAYRTLSTHWPEDEEARDQIVTHVTPDVSVILVVVPPSVQSYGFNEDTGEAAYQVTIPPVVVALRVGATDILETRRLLSLGAAGMSGHYALTSVNENWFALSMVRVRDLESATVRLGDAVLPPVLSAGVEHDDGTYSWFFSFPWPRTILLEQAMALLVDLTLTDVAGRATTVTTSAPPKAQVSQIEPTEPTNQVNMLVALFGEAGRRHHVGFWAWPERRLRDADANGGSADAGGSARSTDGEGPDTVAVIQSELWEFAPTGEGDRVQKKEIVVTREGTGKNLGSLSVKFCPIWPE